MRKGGYVEGERVLDVACGTGFVTRQAAKLVGSAGRVVGSDLNNGMIIAAQKITNATSDLSIEWHTADIINLPFDDESFDVALCQQGMQFFPDIAAAIKELHRVLAPRGRLAFTIWSAIEENPYLEALANALENHLSKQAANGLRAAFAKSYIVDFDKVLNHMGFAQIQVYSPILEFRLPSLEEYLPGHLASLPMAGLITALPDSKKHALLSDMCHALEGYSDGNGLNIPSKSEVISAVR